MKSFWSKKIILAVIAVAMTLSVFAMPSVFGTPTVEKASAQGNVFYVATGGSAGNDGSEGSPWDLQTALNQPAAVTPGTTIWLHGGEYTNGYNSQLNGAEGAPITVRAYPGERVTLIHTSDGPALELGNTSYVDFWGLEIRGPDAERSTSRSKSTNGLRVNQGSSSHHIRLINLIVHDAQAQGFGWWEASKDIEIYGSLFYFNGTDQLDHGVYAHNVDGTKVFRDNMVFDNASHGFHGYAETNEKGLNNFFLDGNTFFNNGSTGYTTHKGQYGIYMRNILVGGLIQSNNAVITNNYTYYPGTSGDSLNLGYDGGSNGAVVRGNYFMGGKLAISGGADNLTLNGNTIYAPGGVEGVSSGSNPDNTWHSERPTVTQMAIRPNAFEPGRANLTIYNWSHAETVWVPGDALGGIALVPGQTYELHNAQNYFGDVITGVYDGSGLSVSMVNHSVAQPLGLGFTPASTFPEFGAFVLIAK